MSLAKRFVKDTAIYGIAAVLPKLINVLLVRLHTGILPPKAYSVNTQFYIYATYFNVLLTLGMETAFFRFFTKYNDNSKVAQTAFTTILVNSLFFLSLFLIFSDAISHFLEIDTNYFQILISILILDTLVVIPYAYLRVTHQPYKFAFYRLFNITIYALLNVVFLWWIPKLIIAGRFSTKFTTLFNEHPKVIYIFVANLVASFLTFLLFLPVLVRFKIGIDKALLKKMLSYGIPIMIAGLAYATNENLDKLLIGRLLDKETMGVYAAVYKIGVLMSLYVTAFRLGAEPYFFSQHKAENAKEQYAHILLWFTILGAVFMVGIMTFLDVIAHLLIGQAVYLKALNIVPIILTAYLIFGIYNNLSVWYKLTDRTRYAMILSIIGAVITIIFNIVMIPKIGYIASAWATLAAYGSMSLLSYYLGRKYYKVPYEMFKIIFYVGSSALTGFVIFKYFYHNYPVKIVILILYILMILILEKQKIKQVLKH